MKKKRMKCIKLDEDTYEELTRLKTVLGVRNYDKLLRTLLKSSELDPYRVAEMKLREMSEEVGKLVPHAYGVLSQLEVLAILSLHLPRERCDALQMELLALLRQIRLEGTAFEEEYR